MFIRDLALSTYNKIRLEFKINIIVSSPFEAGSPKAHAINVVKMAEGFSILGHNVTLLCHSPITGKAELSFLINQYALTKKINFIQLKPRLLGKKCSQQWVFALQCVPWLLRLRPDLIYSRSYIMPWLSSLLGFNTCAETHAHTDNETKEFLQLLNATNLDSFRSLVTIAPTLANSYIQKGASQNKILILPDAVDLANFLPTSANIDSPYKHGFNVVYAGQLYDYKGIQTIVKTALKLPSIYFHLIGGNVEDQNKIKDQKKRKKLHNLFVHGHKPRIDLPNYIWNADILLLPPSANHPSSKWTSPVKLGEYLASGKPVIASDIPALKYWLNDEVVFFKADSPDSLAHKIKLLHGNSRLAKKIGDKGQKLALSLSYEKRANIILEKSFKL